MSQQRAEYERLQSEASQLASQLAQALSQRDLQGNIVAENAQKLVKSAKENELLQKQLEDLGRQVQGLLREISRRDDPTIPSDEDLDTVAVAPAEDTEAVITNNLVLFRSIGGLQDQNQKLLKIVREIGRKMESEEQEYKDAMEREQAEAIKEAHEAIQEMAAQMERQKKSNEGIIQAYVKERDALRAMLARVEKAGVVVEQQNTDLQDTDVVRELVETQSQFEAYRKEMGVDSNKLRDDLTTSQREIGQLAAALAKANAKNEFMTGVFKAIPLISMYLSSSEIVIAWIKINWLCMCATSMTLRSEISNFTTNGLVLTSNAAVRVRTFRLRLPGWSNFVTNAQIFERRRRSGRCVEKCLWSVHLLDVPITERPSPSR